MFEVSRKMLADALDDAGIDVRGDGSEDEVRSYSGRGMYGAECAAVVLPSDALFAFVAALAVRIEREGDDWSWIGEQARTDSMGYDTVLYWPRVALDTMN